jgi:sarcosine oxidase subunit alpha
LPPDAPVLTKQKKSRRVRMSENPVVQLTIDGRTVQAAAGVSVAAAIINAGSWATRNSVTGSPRGPLCGMGICYECRVTIDGVKHRRACLEPVVAGMDVRTRD